MIDNKSVFLLLFICRNNVAVNNDDLCRETMPLKRKSASLTSTSLMKLIFDQLLFEKLGKLKRLSNAALLTSKIASSRDLLLQKEVLSAEKLVSFLILNYFSLLQFHFHFHCY